MSRAMKGDKFATPYTRIGVHYYAPAGSRIKDDFEIKIDKKGHKVLEKVGEHDIYPEIQSYAEECKIENIIARAAAGDAMALNARQGYYADITEFPRDLAEAQNQILKLKNGFDKLPTDIKAKFDNSVEQFVMQFGSEEFDKKMGFVQAAKSEEVEFVPLAEAAKDVLTPEGDNN